VNLHHLEYFVAVAHERSFTRAAQRLHIVQSAVSAAVRALERDLGAELFERSSQRVELTGAGAALLPKAVATLEAAREARDTVADSSGQLHGTLRMGGMPLAGLLDLPLLLGDFHTAHPGVALRLRASSAGSAGLVQALLAGELDVALVSLGERIPFGLTVRTLCSVPMALVVPLGHRLAGRAQVRLADVAEDDFIDAPTGYGNRDVADRAFAAAGLGRRVALEATDVASVTGFVRQGLGVAYLPQFLAAADPEGIAAIPVAGRPVTWSLSLAVPARRPLGIRVRALVDLLDADVDRYLRLPGTALSSEN
jgi:DNA-binding transcriptional LysR family regulator